MGNGLRWTEAEYAAYQARPKVGLTTTVAPPAEPYIAYVETPKDRYATKLERRYAQYLDMLLHENQVKRWEYEPFKLRLAHTCFYTPDFLVIWTAYPDRIELHETKGYWKEDARIKIKVAAEMHDYFTFRAVQYVKGTWKYENF